VTAGDTGPVPGGAPAPRRGRQVSAALVAVWVAAAAVSVTMFVTHREPDGPGATAAGPSASASAAAARSHRDASPSATPPPPSVTITDVGDLNFGMNGAFVPGGQARQLAGVAGDLHADLTVANLETALGTSGTTKCGPGSTDCFAFQAPAAEALGAAQAGFTAVNVANNHTDDAGPAGLQETNAALSAAHLAWTGRPGQITYLQCGGVRVALLGFAPYAYDSNLLNIPAAAAMVHRAAQHARLVIVFIHAGAEGPAAQHVRPGMETYDGELRGNPIAFAHAVVNAGADLVLGSGPHVLRAMQWYRGKLIAYSLGNFAGYYTMGLAGVTSDSAILHVTLTAGGTFVSGSVTPIRLVGAGLPVPDPARAGIQLINSLSREDLGASGVRISRAGVILPPPAPPQPGSPVPGAAVPPATPATEDTPLSTATWASSTAPPR
jgi:poly-gamma-glutamate capsule biosynthesis protein CapA/YwtB (metallophosphatase superfamily)